MTEFNTQVDGGLFRLQFETDNEQHYLLMQMTARQCVGTAKPETNGDRIRAMNNYELAVFLAKIKGDLEYDDRWVVAYSAQDMADNLNWLGRPLQPVADDEPHEHSGLVEEG